MDCGTDSNDHQLFLMGRLLSSEQPRFEALVSSLKSILNPVKGLEMRHLVEGHIHNYCELRFEEGFTDPGEAMLYRAWLRALPANWSSHITGKSSDPPTDRWRQPDTPQEPEVFGMFGDKGKQALQGKEPWGYHSGDGNSAEEVQSAQLKSHVCSPDSMIELLLLPHQLAWCSGCYNSRWGRRWVVKRGLILRKRGREPAILEGGVELIRDEKRRHLLNEESNVSSEEGFLMRRVQTGGDSQIYMDNLTHLDERRCGAVLGRLVVSILGLGFVPAILMKFFVNPRKPALLAPDVKSKSSDPAFMIVSLLIWAIRATSGPWTESIDEILRGMPRSVNRSRPKRRFDGKFNYTYIVLIPKCEFPESMSHLCPISLCNISYKIASKVLANCLKSILKYIVSESQSAFIPGRLITDNVLITYELNHYLAHKTWGSVGHAALKLDLSKA
ncbi:UNVERIFIED_CONTAM: hypothetical protein Scaly_2441000, partial [Sesamum calycinum]